MSDDSKSQYAFGESTNQRKSFAGRSLDRDLAFLRSHLRSGMQVADCGCGAGGLSLQIGRVVAPGQVVGIDQSPGAIEQANKQLAQTGSTNVRFAQASVYASNLEQGTFDIVLFSGVLAHLADPERALRHAYELLKPGGLIAAIEPQKSGDWFAGARSDAMTDINRMYIADFEEIGADPYFGRRMKGMLQTVGFVGVEVVPGYSAALSRVEVAGPAFTNRVSEASFVEKTLKRGSHTAGDLKQLAGKVAEWQADPTAVAALCECAALGHKPA